VQPSPDASPFMPPHYQKTNSWFVFEESKRILQA